MVLRSLPTHSIPHPLDLNIHPALPISPASLGWEHPPLGEAWPALEVFLIFPSQGTIYKHHRYPHIKIRVCLAQGSCESLEFPSISRLLPAAGSPPYSLEPAPIFGFSGLISNLSLVCFFYFPSPAQLSVKLV